MGSFPSAVLVKRGIAGVEILCVQLILCNAQSFAFPFKMKYRPFRNATE